MKKILIYDTTLRDGSQTEGVSFSVNDKLKITEKLDEIGVHYIEGGWPGSNPKDKEFFKLMQTKKLKRAKLAAFSMTRRPHVNVKDDANIAELLKAKTPVITIVGKTWDLHVKDVLKVSLDENCAMIADTVKYLKAKKREVIYDAEHFFDGYKHNPAYALKTLQAAQDAGADCLCLCDTNGGTLPEEVAGIIEELKATLTVPLGIHTHNDMALAVANSLAAIDAGCVHVQGTFNGLGERCGNADLGTLIAILHTKLGMASIPDANVKKLHEACHFLSEISNMPIAVNHPFIGQAAFAHKGGMHIDAVMKNAKSYEHIDPALIGNRRRLIASELAGRMPIVIKAESLGIKIDKKSPEAKKMMADLQQKEHEGYQFEAADASFELFVKRYLNKYKPFFALDGFRVHTERRPNGSVVAEATIHVTVDGETRFSAADGDGPVDALDKALRGALNNFYPSLNEVHLTDYKVRVIDTKEGTAAKVRVLILSQDGSNAWRTVGVHENIIEASWEALVDSIEYKLLKEKKK